MSKVPSLALQTNPALVRVATDSEMGHLHPVFALHHFSMYHKQRREAISYLRTHWRSILDTSRRELVAERDIQGCSIFLGPWEGRDLSVSRVVLQLLLDYVALKKIRFARLDQCSPLALHTMSEIRYVTKRNCQQSPYQLLPGS
jgi:hypothetical protein